MVQSPNGSRWFSLATLEASTVAAASGQTSSPGKAIDIPEFRVVNHCSRCGGTQFVGSSTKVSWVSEGKCSESVHTVGCRFVENELPASSQCAEATVYGICVKLGTLFGTVSGGLS